MITSCLGRIAGTVALLTSSGWAQADPAGHWEGKFKGDGHEIVLTLDLARSGTCWIASMGVPSEGVTGLVVMDLTVNSSFVKFVAVELMMSKFDLTVGADGTMKGTLSGRQVPTPVEFKRTGEPKVELIPPSPAVSKALEGDWEGSLEMPGRAFRIVFHFKNRGDNTVAATIDTPDTGAIGLPLNDIRQTGQSLQIGIRVANAGFKGTLNAEGTELAGQFTHEDRGTPLTLRKK